MHLFRKVAVVFDHSTTFLASLAALLIAFIMLAVVMEVIMRSFLMRPLMWVVEVSEYSLLWITFLGAAWVLKREGHVRMDLLLNRLNPRRQALMNYMTSMIGAIICLTITIYGIKVTWDMFETGYFFARVLSTPKFIILTIIPIGNFLLFIQFLRRANRYRGR